MAKKVKNPSLYRALHKLRKGGLHRALNIPEGTKIPASRLAAARKSSNAHIRHMANFAHTMKSWKH